jgi:WD repeat-containing protein 1 (actin-interacting protein 1)
MSVPHQQVGVTYTTSSAAPIVSLSLSGTLTYLDPSSPQPVKTVHGHQKAITALRTTDDRKSVLTGSYDGRVCAWDVASGDAEVVTESGPGVVQFANAAKALWSITQDDVLKGIDIENLSLR